MNARDNIKPKSIRLAILMALADGEITTIDDLLLKVDEPRNKLVNNAQAAHNEGLIKRMRDDVTNAPAYQITADGRKYVAKFGDGKRAEPKPAAESDEVDKEVERRIEKIASVKPETKKAQAVAVETLEKAIPGFTAEVVAQKDVEIASLSRRLREAEAHIQAVLEWETAMMKAVGEDGLKDVLKAIDEIKASRDNALAELRSIREVISADSEESTFDEVQRIVSQLKMTEASLELARMARTVVHAGYVIQRPVKPLVRFSKIDRAKERALSCARAGKKAHVFALVPVGIATPGAEWVEA